ncbi:MAG: YggT family protein [Candidatus Omnitrophica bacterium CG11_big_fil_rev_8_21_14_0_20_45_26]|uniref:YggT family protein n=1 Tax=Candidatus Abzuiibacterium crystallinum TaxID=1974748 RepID=A0A2H0LQ53_9BACT|nr:MAG: YggT family protein [Candidatus Omnitrophica bacterium CG11_big_fil_rev_8_21_14_0_20_45_26]PIW64183.1 MAG: YggT family protein [Candidatus Omnitrophica bacterium CG12_big_fil_rev_8_21_14_0_65_45_16]
MFIVGQLFASLAVLFHMLFNIIYFLLVIRIVLSWFVRDSYSELITTLYRITDPILMPFQRLPLQVGMIDFSPIVAFLILQFLETFVVRVLTTLAVQFGAGY